MLDFLNHYVGYIIFGGLALFFVFRSWQGYTGRLDKHRKGLSKPVWLFLGTVGVVLSLTLMYIYHYNQSHPRISTKCTEL